MTQYYARLLFEFGRFSSNFRDFQRQQHYECFETTLEWTKILTKRYIFTTKDLKRILFKTQKIQLFSRDTVS